MARASLPARRIRGRPSIGPRATSGVSRRQPSWWATSQRSAATIGPSATACRLAVRCRYPRPIFPSIRMRWVCGWAMAHVASRPSRPRTLSCCRRFAISAYATQFDGTPERPYAYSVRPALARATLPGTAAATPRAAPRPIAATLAIRARIGCGTNHPESTSFGLRQLRSQRGWAPVAGLTKQTGAARQRSV